MNERLRKIAEQNGLIHAHMTAGERRDAEKTFEKITAFIVEECLTTILKESKYYWDKDEFEASNAIQNAARRVKEHFKLSAMPHEDFNEDESKNISIQADRSQ